VRAMLAIVDARLHAARTGILLSCIISAFFGYLNALDPSISLRLTYCGVVGIAWALAQRPGLYVYLDISEACAPLFGRELARAKAIPPILCATLTTIAYWGAQYLRGVTPPVAAALPVLFSTLAATLIALNATRASGAARIGICALAGASISICFIIADIQIGGPWWPAVVLAYCALVAFIALRQYGETLARFDPL
jgi:hypothetical protein